MSNNIILDPDLDRYICPVHLTDLEGDSRVLSCGHPFSSQFIKDIYKNAIKDCPICREPIEHISKNNYVLSEAIGENKQLRRENDNLRQENVVLRGRVSTLEDILENMNTTLKDISSQFKIVNKRTTDSEEANHKLSLQIQEDRTKHEALCEKIKQGEDKYDALEKRFEEDTLSLKTQIAEKNKPVYYPSDSDSDSDSDDDVPLPKKQQIVVSPPPFSKAGAFIADVLSCKHLTRILNGQRN